MTANEKHRETAREICAYHVDVDYIEGRVLVSSVAAALAAAEREGMKRAAEICEKMSGEFLSPRYASNQPIGSLTERFACDECVRAILSEAEGK
jgi:hypothetical protein